MAGEGAFLLAAGFVLLLAAGAPLAVALGATGALVVVVEGLGVMSVPTSTYGGIAKYPLLALPVFILAGLVFERAGVALRIVRFMTALVGSRRGAQGVVAIMVCMLPGGISGSRPADAAAVAMVMIPAMAKQGYPRAFSASLIAAAGSTAILIPPSIAFIVYSVLLPQASVPALFAAGVIPGMLAGLSLMLPVVYFSLRHGWGAGEDAERVGLWRSFRDALWGLAAPVIILGGLRSGFFTPTEAAVVAAIYGFFVGIVVYRSLDLRAIYRVLVDAAEIAAVVMIIIGLAAVFAHAGNTVGAFDAFARTLLGLTGNEAVMLVMVMAIVLAAGMVLDGVSIFLVFLPILVPIMTRFGWDPVWFGVLLTMNIAIGQFTPPMAVNLMVTSKIGGVTMESTVRWVIWMVVSMLGALALVELVPATALWLPRALGF